MLVMFPVMILSTLSVILFASFTQGLSLDGLLGLSSDSNFIGSDGTGHEGNIDLTERVEGGRGGDGGGELLPPPKFTAYGSPTAPSYLSYTFSGPPSTTGLASLAHTRGQQEEGVYERVEEEREEEGAVGEGSLVSWLAVPAMVVLGLLFLPTGVPGSGLLTTLALDSLAVGELREEARQFLADRPQDLSSLTNLDPMGVFVMVLAGLLLAPLVYSYYGWNLEARGARGAGGAGRAGGEVLATVMATLREALHNIPTMQEETAE